MKEIPLTQGYVAIVDDADYEEIAKFRWFAQTVKGSKRVEARRYGGKTESGRMVIVNMHRQIVDAPDGKDVDHINGDSLDNRRSNLRICSRAENRRNARKTKGKSKYKGVNPLPNKTPTWMASIYVNGRLRHIGRFASEEEAAKAYDNAARAAFGTFAAVNFPVGNERCAIALEQEHAA